MRALDAPLGNGHGCRGCGRVFKGLTGFDRHQRLSLKGLVCLDPATLGMTKRANGHWSLPAPMHLATVGIAKSGALVGS